MQIFRMDLKLFHVIFQLFFSGKIIGHAVGRSPLLSAVSGLRTPSFTPPFVQQSVKQELVKDCKQEQDLFTESE